MGQLHKIYRSSLALLTDLYELTMAYGYWKLGRADQEAVFHLFFRTAPFGGGTRYSPNPSTLVRRGEGVVPRRADWPLCDPATGNRYGGLRRPESLGCEQRRTAP